MMLLGNPETVWPGSMRPGLSSTRLVAGAQLMRLGSHNPHGLGLSVLGYLLPGWWRGRG